MKLSIVIGKEGATPSAFVVLRGFEESIRTAAAYGYSGIELALKTAQDIDAPKLRAWLDKYNMQVSCISTGQVFADLGLYLTNPDNKQREKAVGIFKELIELAGEFGGMVNIGRARGFVANTQTYAEAKNIFLDSLSILCEYAQNMNVDILIEPVNRYEINFINNLEQAAAVLKESGKSNLGLMPDLFHMNIDDAKIGQSLIEHAKHIKYIHLADSNRYAPGMGHTDFTDVFNCLSKSGYDGWASVEIIPYPDPDTAAKRAASYILPFISKHNKERLI